jgi:hypothetical protein
MTADLVTRLRGWLDEDVPIGVIMNEAADEIERLRDVMQTAIRQFEDGNRLSCHRTLCDEVYGKQK